MGELGGLVRMFSQLIGKSIWFPPQLHEGSVLSLRLSLPHGGNIRSRGTSEAGSGTNTGSDHSGIEKIEKMDKVMSCYYTSLWCKCALVEERGVVGEPSA